MIRDFVRFNRALSSACIRRFPTFFDEPSYEEPVHEEAREWCAKPTTKAVLEAGGSDRPFLSRSSDYALMGMDIDDRPLCTERYDDFFVQSVEEPFPSKFDLVCSMALLEHVPDNEATFRNIFEALNAGGLTLHYVPSKHHPYAVCLRLVGPKLQRILIKYLRPHAIAETGYPAFFDYCSPSGMEGLLRRCGFKDIEIRPYYRANDYFAWFFPAFLAVTAFENVCKVFDVQTFCSGIHVRARKPGAVGWEMSALAGQQVLGDQSPGSVVP